MSWKPCVAVWGTLEPFHGESYTTTGDNCSLQHNNPCTQTHSRVYKHFHFRTHPTRGLFAPSSIVLLPFRSMRLVFSLPIICTTLSPTFCLLSPLAFSLARYLLFLMETNLRQLSFLGRHRPCFTIVVACRPHSRNLPRFDATLLQC